MRRVNGGVDARVGNGMGKKKWRSQPPCVKENGDINSALRCMGTEGEGRENELGCGGERRGQRNEGGHDEEKKEEGGTWESNAGYLRLGDSGGV
ncbi:hypothetical protein Pcinc_034379 [Petrolisthes cinctipes]|uniref:Uncharacterized protein n=1 Tax=Petrolisthes cinctipes TaxID=88211 RepID=A0AAE1EQE5_PETCI|nr:hypothetical protein Pcinc_034379 [Petrolisthes cinctipes]